MPRALERRRPRFERHLEAGGVLACDAVADRRPAASRRPASSSARPATSCASDRPESAGRRAPDRRVHVSGVLNRRRIEHTPQRLPQVRRGDRCDGFVPRGRSPGSRQGARSSHDCRARQRRQQQHDAEVGVRARPARRGLDGEPNGRAEWPRRRRRPAAPPIATALARKSSNVASAKWRPGDTLPGFGALTSSRQASCAAAATSSPDRRAGIALSSGCSLVTRATPLATHGARLRALSDARRSRRRRRCPWPAAAPASPECR